jgi:cyclopropane-fatty-acyl-phospholipid synthase
MERNVASVFKPIMSRMLAASVLEGELSVTWPDGSFSRYGNGRGFKAGVRIVTAAALRGLVYNPGLGIGEGYMNGGLVPVGCGIFDLLVLLMSNIRDQTVPIIAINAKLGRMMRPFLQANRKRMSRHNVAHHYDLNGRLYALFLDRDRQYSCAYFPRGDETLEEAQAAKKHHIAAKLNLNRPGLSVLDIGCGWGGMAMTLARDYGAVVTGITLSEEQLAEARARAQAAGLADRVSFKLMDYRDLDQPFDRIVSVGMFEHVGVPNYPAFFATIRRCLAADGVAVMHSIGRFDGPGATNSWIAKYIFPGGYSPALSEVMGPLESAGLMTADIEILRLHYAKTISHWRRRFAANRDAIAALYDERFCRMFEFYLCGSELSFRASDHMNFQIQMIRSREAVPLTRDYMFEGERQMQFQDVAE